MRPELVTALAELGECVQLLRDRKAVQPPKRFGKHRTHKANSAESILRHVLRQRGWTRIYGDGGLNGRQHLNLLEDVRQYGRQWFRHEAESFFDRYAQELDVERGLASRAAGAIGRFFDRARQFVRELIFAGAIAFKGDDEFDESEQSALNHQANIQRQYFDKFEREVVRNPPREIADLSTQIIVAAPPPMTPGQFVARMELYGNAAWHAAQVNARGGIIKSGLYNEERRVLGDAKHCEDCPPLAELGWQPIGTLPGIGSTECMGFCHCHFEYRGATGKTHLKIEKPKAERPRDVPRPKGKKFKPIPEPKEPKGIPEAPIEEGPHKRLPRPLPTIEQLLKEAGSPYSADEYEDL